MEYEELPSNKILFLSWSQEIYMPCLCLGPVLGILTEHLFFNNYSSFFVFRDSFVSTIIRN